MPQTSHSYNGANSASARSGQTAAELSLRKYRDELWESEHENRQTVTLSGTAPYLEPDKSGRATARYPASGARKTMATHSAYDSPPVVNTAVIDRMVEYVVPPFGTARDSVTGKLPKKTFAAAWSDPRQELYRSERSCSRQQPTQ